jgi:hypothetical protein
MRTVIKTQRFLSELDAIATQFGLDAEEILEGLDWVLARDAEDGTKIENDESVITMFCITYDISVQHSILVFYNFENEDVCLQSAVLSVLDELF